MDTPFLELSPLAAHRVYDRDIPGAGIITGIGRISGKQCVVVVNDTTVDEGSYYSLTVCSLAVFNTLSDALVYRSRSIFGHRKLLYNMVCHAYMLVWNNLILIM